MRWGFGALIVLLLFEPSAHAGSRKDLEKCWDGADSDTERIEACTRAMKSSNLNEGERAELYASRARAYEREGRHAEAVADLDPAISLEPYEPSRLVRHGRRAFNFYMLKDYDKAIADYDKALTRKPDDPHLLYFRGLSYLQKGDAARGFADLDQVVALKPNDPESYVRRADAYVERGENEKALPDLDKAIALKPDHRDAYFARAKVNQERGDNEKALADFTRVTEIDPAGQQGFLLRAILHQRLGNIDLALADYEKLLTLAPDEQFYRDRRAALQAKGVIDAPSFSPAPKTPAPLATTPAPEAPTPVATPPAKAEGNLAVAAELPVDCKVFVPAANMTVTIPCGK